MANAKSPVLQNPNTNNFFLAADGTVTAFNPGSHAPRPRVSTPYGSVVLAGDFVKLPFPTALMERAASSGMLAANHLLDRWDVRGEPLYSIPQRGFMAGLPL